MLRRFLLKSLLSGLLMPVWGVNETVAQIAGVVSAEDGAPLSAVTVELWRPQERSAVFMTAATGLFRFDSVQTRGAARMIFSRIGYEPVILQAVRLNTFVRITMPVAPVSIPAVTAQTSARLCPNHDDPQAHTVWEAAKRRYSSELGSRSMSVDMLMGDESLVPIDRVGMVDESSLKSILLRYAGTTADVTPGRHVNVNTQIAEFGYAFPTKLDEPRWRFPELDGRQAYHFISDLFPRLNSLSISDQTGGETTIAFCSVRRDRPGIKGRLVIGSDTSLVSAHWTFRIPGSQLIAGGEVFFYPIRPDPAVRVPILPARGIGWIQNARWKDRYSQRSMVFRSWGIGESDSLPQDR